MITLLRWAFWLSALSALLWFAATVPLGERTLLQHMRAISATPEAKSLAAGTRDEAAKVAERVRKQLGPEGAEPAAKEAAPSEAARPPGTEPPSEQLDDRDREALDRVVRERSRAKASRAAPR